MRLFCFLLSALFFGQPLWAYPDFIGYGYTSCMACHYNGAGGGSLTDYAKGVWAAEIAAKPFWRSNASNEELSEDSGFPGAKSLPWWYRPGLKYRGLNYQSQFRSANESSRFINMQLDWNNAFFFDKKQNTILIASAGYLPSSGSATRGGNDEESFISREFYLRHKVGERSWIYLGLLDKVFGLRIPDHTSYSRQALSLAQNDQSHSLIYQSSSGNHEFFLQAFAGNLYQEAALRQVGGTGLYEYQFAEAKRWGFSYLESKNDYVALSRLSTHTKIGLQDGNSFLAELGVTKDTPQISGESTFGAFSYVQAVLRLKRGLSILSAGEYYKKNLDAKESEKFRWHFGLIYFPMQRVEFRSEFINSRSLSPEKINSEGWTFLNQIHLSI